METKEKAEKRQDTNDCENTKQVLSSKVNHGHNIRLARLLKGMKQSTLADLMNIDQANISRYENKRVIEDHILEKFAQALSVPVEDLKAMEEDASQTIFQNNTITNTNNNLESPGAEIDIIAQDASTNDITKTTTDNRVINPLEKITELYERLLKEKEEKYLKLEQRIQELEQKAKE